MVRRTLSIIHSAVLLSGFGMATAARAAPHTPEPGSAERRAICDVARAHVVQNYASKPLPQPIVFKIEHLVVMDRFANVEAVAMFKDGSPPAPVFMADIVFNLCLQRTQGGWHVVADLSRTDVPEPAEVAQIRDRLPRGFPLGVLSETWRKLLSNHPQ
jgi:hypothetical protein